MNAPSPALVAPRPERLRLVGQRRQLLAVMHQRLMFGMLVYAGDRRLIALRILYLAAFGDHAGRKEELTAFVPERGDIVDRNGDPLARTIDAWTIAIHPDQGHRRQACAGAAASPQLMPEHSEEQYFALLRSGKPFFYLRRRASPGLVEAVNALGEPGLAIAARARPALSADHACRACARLSPISTGTAAPGGARVRPLSFRPGDARRPADRCRSTAASSRRSSTSSTTR